MTARVLIVDDLLPNIKLLEARLTAEYFDVISATNGVEAIEACRLGGCDIVLLDVMMPGMDGFEVCQRLKGDPATAHLPVVMVTALDQPADRVRGLTVGADDFLTKPVDEIALIARVRSLRAARGDARRTARARRHLRASWFKGRRRARALAVGRKGPHPSGRRPSVFGGADRRRHARTSCRRGRARTTERAVPRRQGRIRPCRRCAEPGEFRRAASMQPAAFAGANPRTAHSVARRSRGATAHLARSRSWRERLHSAADRPQ